MSAGRTLRDVHRISVKSTSQVNLPTELVNTDERTNGLTKKSKTSRDISPSDTCARVRDFDEFRKRPNRITRQHRAGGKRMTPVLQTHLGDMDANPVGNCLQASVASLLDLPLDDVPHFVQDARAADESGWMRLDAWLAARGLVRREVDVDTPGYLLVSGPTRGGVHHVVIYRDGQLAHDPHPVGEGLFYAEWFYAISAATTKGISS